MEIITGIIGTAAIITGFMVITAKNPVHSVLNLVLTFILASVLLLIIGVEFLPLLFIIVYVGAIAILFLFVVMMLNIKRVELADNATRYVPIGFIIGMMLLSIMKNKVLPGVELNTSEGSSGILESQFSTPSFSIVTSTTNIETIGQILYTHYFLFFLMAGVILLIAMLGAIVLSIRHEADIKRQDIFSQIATQPTLTLKYGV
jgi:NADH-quinone oxidoreductase subunit J